MLTINFKKCEGITIRFISKLTIWYNGIWDLKAVRKLLYKPEARVE